MKHDTLLYFFRTFAMFTVNVCMNWSSSAGLELKSPNDLGLDPCHPQLSSEAYFYTSPNSQGSSDSFILLVNLSWHLVVPNIF